MKQTYTVTEVINLINLLIAIGYLQLAQQVPIKRPQGRPVGYSPKKKRKFLGNGRSKHTHQPPQLDL